MSREQQIAARIIELAGGRGNINELECCMTRLRIDPKNLEAADQGALKKVDGVKGVIVTGGQLQVILGPGLAQKVADEAGEIMRSGPAPTSTTVKTDAPEAKKAVTAQSLLRQIASIFVPLLPAIIAAGMIIALNNVLQKFFGITPKTAIMGYSVVTVLTILGNTIMGYLSILVGGNAAKLVGGPFAIGAMAGAILISPTLTSLNMTAGRGGLIGAALAGAFFGWMYKRLTKVMPEAINIIATPAITALAGGLLALFVLQPIGFWVSSGIGSAATALINTVPWLAGPILAGTFLPLVLFGIHQALTPIHLELINKFGYTILLPILAMGGAGQVGAALAVYTKTKDQELKKIITAALPVGILGIGEPLIYGVTLPLFRPFIGACIGAAAGGLLMAVSNVGATAIGPSGVILALLATKPLIYLIGLAIAYVVGYFATLALGWDESKAGVSQTFDING
ncbi:MAG TPA: PTS transporter subunit EIIC [Symbiobacteriaceae bacterium]|nr:PTS transporter subunit EIIC [Symbiobacteriaceae bacterium]